MRKHYLIFPFLFFLHHFSSAQELEEVLLDGLIVVSDQTSPEGIHVFNKSNNHGSVATPGGRFELLVKSGDTLHFSGIQFEALEVVITEGMIASGLLRVEIREGLNQLPDVVIKEHDLSGSLTGDSKIIITEDFEIPMVPPPVGPPTGVKTPENSAMNEMSGGANILGLLGAGIGLLFPKRIKEAPPEKHEAYNQIRLRQKLRNLLGEEFFIESLDLKEREIANFLDFSIGPDFQSKMLDDKHRLDLLQFLMDRHQEFVTSEQ